MLTKLGAIWHCLVVASNSQQLIIPTHHHSIVAINVPLIKFGRFGVLRRNEVGDIVGGILGNILFASRFGKICGFVVTAEDYVQLLGEFNFLRINRVCVGFLGQNQILERIALRAVRHGRRALVGNACADFFEPRFD